MIKTMRNKIGRYNEGHMKSARVRECESARVRECESARVRKCERVRER